MLFDPRYHAAGPIASVLGVGVWIQVLSVSYGSCLLAVGNSRAVFWATCGKSVSFAITVQSAFFHFGVLGITAAFAGSELAVYVICILHARQYRITTLTHDLCLTFAVMVGAGSIHLAIPFIENAFLSMSGINEIYQLARSIQY